MHRPEADADSFWTASARTPAFAGEMLQGDRIVDVAIVGGGFTGLSTALHLAEAGRSVAVLEARDIGYGASGRNGGQVNPGLKYEEAALIKKFGPQGSAFYRLGQEAPDFLVELVKRLGLDCDLRRSGLIRLAHNERALATLRAAQADFIGRGLPITPLERKDIEALVGTDRYHGGWVDARGANVHPLDLVRELARAAASAGALIFPHSPALRLVRRNDGWNVATQSGSLQARNVVVATNGYTDQLVPGLQASLLPVNSFQIATAPLDEVRARRILPQSHTVYDSRRLILYFRRSADGRVILGGRSSFSSSRGLGARRADYSVLEGVLTGIFPDLAGVPITHRWTGLVCITMDFLPHYHEPEDGLHVVLGFNGRGVALSHRAGAWMANHLLGRPDSGAMPRTPIRPVPFHAWREPLLNVAMQWNRLLDRFGR
jgi:glycine/D-amino acid oxidase-like deaminating enzyme